MGRCKSLKPVLFADAAHWAKPFTPGWPPAEDRTHDAAAYTETLNRLLDIPSCVGYPLCGAYLKNNARRYGFRNARNQIERHVAETTRANRAAAARFTKETS